MGMKRVERTWFVVPPLPICPYSFSPQLSTLPSAFSSSAWLPPPTTCALSLPTATSSTGERRFVVVPSPSWLLSFAPQLNSRPSLLSAMPPLA